MLLVCSGRGTVLHSHSLDHLYKYFYVFTGSTVDVVPILSKGLYTGKVAQLGSAKAIIH